MMKPDIPVLYVFAISHYCEKARWALDYLDIDYELRYVGPGEHAQIAKKLGAPKSSVPFVEVDGTVVHGSANIIEWADKRAGSTDKRLAPSSQVDLCNSIEQRIDDVAGVHIRRYYYSEALVNHPDMVRPIFTRDLTFLKSLMIRFAFPKIRNVMIKRMDLGEAQGLESREVVASELDWVDSLLADGRNFLVGEQFSRADMAVASLLSPLTLPPQHPVYRNFAHPPGLARQVAKWSGRPSFEWVQKIYADYR